MTRNYFLAHGVGPGPADVCGILQQYGVVQRIGAASGFGSSVRTVRLAGVLVGDWEVTPKALLGAVAAIRRERPLVPVLASLQDRWSQLTHALAALDVECLPAPLSVWLVHRFAQRALAFGALPDEAVARWVSHVAGERGLLPREVQLWTLALQHAPRARMRRLLGVSENTLKTQIRGLLRKLGETSLDCLAKNTLRTALLEARPGTRDLYRAPWLPERGAQTAAHDGGHRAAQ